MSSKNNRATNKGEMIKMKYFEMNDDYYALIKAKDKDEAVKLYSLEEEDEHFLEEVSRDYALAMFSRSLGEDGSTIPINEVLRDFSSDENLILLIDGGLL